MGEALAWLDRHVNLEAIEAGRAGRHGLPTVERIAAVMNASGDPQHSYPVIHLTGTNGKGSTSRICAALLRAQGLKVGVYSSPHLETINERLVIDGQPIEDDELARQLGELAELEVFLGERLGMQLSWFEIMTACAYRWFAAEAIDAAVVEVGLGGRFDATNVAHGAVAAVTNVSLDHTDILGATRQQIAGEKAGIVKSGSVLVLGEDDDEIAQIFEEEAVHVGAVAVWRRHHDFGVENLRMAVGGRAMDLFTPAARYHDIFLPLRGAHQADNAAVALAAAQAFTGAPIAEDVVDGAFGSVTAPGRLEVVGRSPLIVLDGAHNVAGAAAVGAALAQDFRAAKRVIVVMGCLRGRDPGGLLESLLAAGAPVELVIGCRPPSPRAQDASAVVKAAAELGLKAFEAEADEEAGRWTEAVGGSQPGSPSGGSVSQSGTSIPAAIERAVQAARPDDLVLVTGSLYVVGAARTLLRPAGRLH